MLGHNSLGNHREATLFLVHPAVIAVKPPYRSQLDPGQACHCPYILSLSCLFLCQKILQPVEDPQLICELNHTSRRSYGTASPFLTLARPRSSPSAAPPPAPAPPPPLPGIAGAIPWAWERWRRRVRRRSGRRISRAGGRKASLGVGGKCRGRDGSPNRRGEERPLPERMPPFSRREMCVRREKEGGGFRGLESRGSRVQTRRFSASVFSLFFFFHILVLSCFLKVGWFENLNLIISTYSVTEFLL